MPITITPLGDPILTPMQQVNWSSDVIGPFPVGSHIEFALLETGGEGALWAGSLNTQASQGTFTLFDRAFGGLTQQSVVTRPADEGAQLHISATYFDDRGNVVDTGQSSTFPWKPTAGLPGQVLNQQTTQGGLTPVQANQLQQTFDNTVITHLVDTVTLINLTPAGPTDQPVNAFLPDPVFGVIVRLASVPAELLPTTPDGDYWVKTLCVVRLYRGSDLWKRYPIHTSSKLTSFLDDSITLGVTTFTVGQWLLNLSMQVSFLPGVTGTVFLMRFP